MAKRTAPALIALALIAAGCGEGSVAKGATVSVYVAKPLCSAADGELAKEGKRVGDVLVRIVCLPPVQRRKRADLATAGANARRATQDSTAVAFLEATGPAAKFTESIVEAAGIAWVETSDGATAMHRVLRALSERGSTSPRAAVLDQVS
ncbi:MAG: hypothetical protein ACTHNP_13900 [Solirubrobacterales bacterium]